MKKIKKGDNVTRNSYNNDIIFKVDKIIKKSNNINIAILQSNQVNAKQKKTRISLKHSQSFSYANHLNALQLSKSNIALATMSHFVDKKIFTTH